MSFILDALKKAESERNRRVAPVLMDARVAMPRRGLPAWAWAWGAILVANLVVLAWLLLRDASPEEVAAIAPVPGAVTSPGQVPTGAGAGAGGAGTAAGAGAGVGADATASGARAMQSGAGTGVVGGAGMPTNGPAFSPGGATLPATPASADPSARTVPGIVAIVPSAASAAIPPRSVDADDVPAIDVAALPTADELRARGVALPDLQLNLHIYNVSPAARSVLLNGQRVREGDYTPNGVKLERITPDGVVLEAAGRRYRVDAGG